MKKNFYILILFFTFFFPVENQASTDADKYVKMLRTARDDSTKGQIYLKLGNFYRNNNTQKTIEYYSLSNACFKQAGLTKAYTDGIISLGIYYMIIGVYNEAEAAIKLGISLSIKNHDRENEIYAKSQLGAVYRQMGRYMDANEIFKRIINKNPMNRIMDSVNKLQSGGRKLSSEKKGYFGKIISLYNSYSIVLFDMQQTDKAIELEKMAYDLAWKIGDEDRLNMTCFNMICDYSDIQQYDKALELLKIYEKNGLKKNDESILDDVKILKAEVYKRRGNYQEAMRIMNSLDLSSSPIIINACNYLQLKAEIAAKLNDYSEFKKNIDKVYKLKDKSEFNVVNNIYSYYIEYYQIMKDYKTALLYSDTLQNICDSVFSTGDMGQLVKQIALTQYQNKLNEIKLLKKQNTLLNNKVNMEQKTRLLLGVLAVIVLAIIALFLRNIRFNKRAARLFQSKNAELRELNSELAVSNSTKDKFFSIIAHDLKNPIGNTKNALEILRDCYSDLENEEKKEYISMLKDASESAYMLLDDLLVWSYSQRGEIEYHPRMIKPVEIAAGTVSLQSLAARNKNLKLSNNVDPNLEIYADSKLVMTILRNLVSNSIKFTTEGGEIEIGSGKAGETGMALLFVRDTGIGIPPEKIDLLFRVDTNISTPGTAGEKGTGLGLILCQEFAEKNGGKITVKSELGKGTEFDLLLPGSAEITKGN